MFQTIEQEDRVNPRLARAFFVAYAVIGMAVTFTLLHRHGIGRLDLLLAPAIISAVSVWWAMKRNYSRRAFQTRVSLLLILIGVDSWISLFRM